MTRRRARGSGTSSNCATSLCATPPALPGSRQALIPRSRLAARAASVCGESMGGAAAHRRGCRSCRTLPAPPSPPWPGLPAARSWRLRDPTTASPACGTPTTSAASPCPTPGPAPQSSSPTPPPASSWPAPPRASGGGRRERRLCALTRVPPPAGTAPWRCGMPRRGSERLCVRAACPWALRGTRRGRCSWWPARRRRDVLPFTASTAPLAWTR